MWKVFCLYYDPAIMLHCFCAGSVTFEYHSPSLPHGGAVPLSVLAPYYGLHTKTKRSLSQLKETLFGLKSFVYCNDLYFPVFWFSKVNMSC